MLYDTIRKGNQCGGERHRFSVSLSQEEVMRGHAPAFPVSSFDEVYRGVGTGRQTPTRPRSAGRRYRARPSCPPCVCV